MRRKLAILNLGELQKAYFETLIASKAEEESRSAQRESSRLAYDVYPRDALEQMLKAGHCKLEDKDIISEVIKDKKSKEAESKKAEKASATLAARLEAGHV
jgi:hypothetical protein